MFAPQRERRGEMEVECDRVDISIVYSWATWATQQVEHGQSSPALSVHTETWPQAEPGNLG